MLGRLVRVPPLRSSVRRPLLRRLLLTLLLLLRRPLPLLLRRFCGLLRLDGCLRDLLLLPVPNRVANNRFSKPGFSTTATAWGTCCGAGVTGLTDLTAGTSAAAAVDSARVAVLLPVLAFFVNRSWRHP